jgi:ABC-type transport system involved in multi-copper enzyme maturation permease subunit
MTATTVPHLSGAPAAPGRGSFRRLLRSEWTKFRSVRGWIIALVAGGLLVGLIGLWAANGGSASCAPVTPAGPAGGAGSGGCTAPVGPGGEAVTDTFYFVRQPLAGNGTLTARLSSLTGRYSTSGGINPQDPEAGMTAGVQPWSKAGLIITASTRPGSAYAAVMVTGAHGVRMQYDYTRDIAGLPGSVSAAAPRWLRLTRAGDTVTGYDSPDGTNWTTVGTATLTGLTGTVQAGLFATSPQAGITSHANGGPSVATAVFGQASLSPARPPAGWHGGEIGPRGGDFGNLVGRFRQAGGQLTVTGSGDIAPLVAGGPVPGTPADSGYGGIFAGLIVLIALGAVFITAEYRRGLIRTTLAATPRRGQVLAAKAIVVGLATFAAALPGTALTVLAGASLLRGHGNVVFPATALLQVRVITGAAAVVALAAVLALALGAILRSSAGAITAVIMLIVLPYFFAVPLAVLPAGAADWLLRVTPAAGFAIGQMLTRYPQVINAYTPVNGYYPLAPWAGLAVLAAWTVAGLGLALVLMRRRDA